PATARDLGTVVHFLGQPQAIVSGYMDAYYALTVPTEAVNGAGDEVLDFSAQFQFVQGTGLQMEVLDAVTKQVLGSASRFRVQAAQGQRLLVHIFGLPASGGLPQGTGIYTLGIDVLPQVVSAEAPPAVPGGSANSIVLVFQGDRLDPITAENSANYRVTWLGPDGLAGTTDDRVLTIASATGGQPVLYNPGGNVDVSSGKTSPTAVRQTVTLLFAQPLPVGSYQIEILD